MRLRQPRPESVVMAAAIVTLTVTIACPDWPFIDRSNMWHRIAIGLFYGSALGTVCLFVVPRAPRLSARCIWRASAAYHGHHQRSAWRVAILVAVIGAAVVAMFLDSAAPATRPPVIAMTPVPTVEWPQPRVFPLKAGKETRAARAQRRDDRPAARAQARTAGDSERGAPAARPVAAAAAGHASEPASKCGIKARTTLRLRVGRLACL